MSLGGVSAICGAGTEDIGSGAGLGSGLKGFWAATIGDLGCGASDGGAERASNTKLGSCKGDFSLGGDTKSGRRTVWT